jgi:uncharacterized protein YjeT (DUF2065 family)
MLDLLVALGLVLVIEGLTFAAFPGGAKRALAVLVETPERNLRVAGLVSAVIGLAVVWVIRG